MRLFQWLGILEADTPASDRDALAAIEAQLDGLDPARARFLACFAYLLGRVARADHEVSDLEAQAMERLVADRAALPSEQAALVVRIATAHGLRFGGTDDFLIAREFGARASHAEKLTLLDCLFAVSAADRGIRTLEDNEIRRIAAELQIGIRSTSRCARLTRSTWTYFAAERRILITPSAPPFDTYTCRN